jgi:membrane protein DedA with SNARE-associated domain
MTMTLVHGGGAIALAMAIVLGAFASEDGATITAATFAASGLLDFRLAFLSAFAGLWAGDLGVYALTRGIGPRIMQHRWFAGWFRKEKTPKGNTTGSNGQLTLALSRFLPGTRLLAYISAGLERMPVFAFARVTAVSAIAWVLLVFATIQLVPSRSSSAKQQLAILSLFGLGLFALLSAWRRWGHGIRSSLSISFERIVRWEFWPAWLFYSPVAAICFWLGLRYRGFSLPTIANLNQKNGGIVGESKIGILQTLMETSPEFTSDGYLVPEGSVENRIESIGEICLRHQIRFPFVLKPDTAQRGAGFRKVSSFDEAEKYLDQVSAPLLLQRYVEGPEEAGIFYYRFPNEKKGHIFGITRKQFPVLMGDGVRSIRELIEADSRARLIAQTYLQRFELASDRILRQGECMRLVEAGNHCQGCIFKDGADLNSEKLRAAFDEISHKLPGFYIGRYDIRYISDEELRAGRGFQIIELNGAASEATNIYDAGNSLWSAYATLYQQWKLVYRIGATNRKRGHRPASALTVLRDWIEFSRRSMEYPLAD